MAHYFLGFYEPLTPPSRTRGPGVSLSFKFSGPRGQHTPREISPPQNFDAIL